MYLCIYIYTYTNINICIYIYICNGSMNIYVIYIYIHTQNPFFLHGLQDLPFFVDGGKLNIVRSGFPKHLLPLSGVPADHLRGHTNLAFLGISDCLLRHSTLFPPAREKLETVASRISQGLGSVQPRASLPSSTLELSHIQSRHRHASTEQGGRRKRPKNAISRKTS